MDAQELNELLAAKNDIVDEVTSYVEKNMAGVKKAISKKIIDDLQKYPDGDNSYLMDVDKIVNRAFRQSKYPELINAYIDKFELINENNSQIHKVLNGLATDMPEIKKVQTVLIQKVIDDMTGAGVDINFTQPLRGVLYNHAVAGGTIADAKELIEAYVVGKKNTLGHLERYVGQVARDGMMQYDGGLNEAVAKEYGITTYVYVGSLIEDSRPQCRRWVAMGTLDSSEIEREISWARINGSGMIPGTNTENIARYRGGYNCRHSMIPIAEPGETKNIVKTTNKATKTAEAKNKLSKFISESVNIPNATKKQYEDIYKGLAATIGKYKIVVNKLTRTRAKSYWGQYYLKYNKKTGVFERDEIRLCNDLFNPPDNYHKLYLIRRNNAIKDYEKVINPSSFEKYKLKELKATKRFSVSTSAGERQLEATVRHEGWHAVYFRKNLRDPFIKNLKEQNVTRLDMLRVSEYAADDGEELFAEIGAAIDLGIEIPENLKKAFEETIKTIK
jgi:hypothetical protein